MGNWIRKHANMVDFRKKGDFIVYKTRLQSYSRVHSLLLEKHQACMLRKIIN